MTAEIICCGAALYSTVLLIWSWGVRHDARVIRDELRQLSREANNRRDAIEMYARTVDAATTRFERAATPPTKAQVKR